jgi:hypothetical protein
MAANVFVVRIIKVFNGTTQLAFASAVIVANI